MIICQVDARISDMSMEEIEQELELLGEVLAALDGELISVEVCPERRSLTAYLRSESELVVSDIFEATGFVAEQIVYLGPSHPPIDFNRPLARSMWRYRPAPANRPVALATHPLRKPA